MQHASPIMTTLRHLPNPPPSALETLARPAGFEPATLGLEGRCSIRVSYGRPKRYPAQQILVGVEGFEPPTSCSQSRRATRLRYTPESFRRPCHTTCLTPRQIKGRDNTRSDLCRQSGASYSGAKSSCGAKYTIAIPFHRLGSSRSGLLHGELAPAMAPMRRFGAS